MNRDPFLRLALIVSVTAYAVALAVVWRELGVGAFAGGLVGGIVGAAALTVERSAEASPAGPERPDPRRFRTGPRP